MLSVREQLNPTLGFAREKGRQLSSRFLTYVSVLNFAYSVFFSFCFFLVAALLAAETYLSAKKKKELTGEDTNLFHPSIVVGVIVVSSGLLSSRNELLGKVGLLFTSIAAFAVIGKYAKRFLEAGEYHYQSLGERTKKKKN